jgi:hypothetical protein
VHLVIDALDECQVAKDIRKNSFHGLFNIQKHTNANVLATSRFNSDIQRQFGQSVMLEIRATAKDIDQYISDQMVYLPFFIQRNPELKYAIKTGILNVARGM